MKPTYGYIALGFLGLILLSYVTTYMPRPAPVDPRICDNRNSEAAYTKILPLAGEIINNLDTAEIDKTTILYWPRLSLGNTCLATAAANITAKQLDGKETSLFITTLQECAGADCEVLQYFWSEGHSPFSSEEEASVTQPLIDKHLFSDPEDLCMSQWAGVAALRSVATQTPLPLHSRLSGVSHFRIEQVTEGIGGCRALFTDVIDATPADGQAGVYRYAVSVTCRGETRACSGELKKLTLEEDL